MIVNKAMFPVRGNFAQIARMQQQLSDLQTQLGTGEKAATLAGMGQSRSTSLTLRSQISTMTGFKQSISTVDLRLTMLGSLVSNLDKIEGEARTSETPGGYGTNDVNLTTAPTIARSRLDQVLTVLNSDINGRYLFGGATTDKKPVPTMSELLEGSVGRAGFNTVKAQRLQADQGVVQGDGSTMGRISVAAAGTNTVRLGDDASPFGMKLDTILTSGASVTTTGPSGPRPASLDIAFMAVPLDGEKIEIGFTMPDGSHETLRLSASADAPGDGEFQIGADAAATAANFRAAATAAVKKLSATKLAAASAYAAADDFFAKQGQVPQRVDGPPYDTATGLVAGTEDNTVIWYRGADDNPARNGVSAKIDENTTVNYGVQANEEGIAELVKSLAVMATSTFLAGDATAHERFDATAGRQISRLAEDNNSKQGSIEVIAVELGMAQVTVKATQDRQSVYQVQMDSLLSDIEGVSNEDVGMQLLALKTRLEATYSVTSMVSQLSLVNYIK